MDVDEEDGVSSETRSCVLDLPEYDSELLDDDGDILYQLGGTGPHLEWCRRMGSFSNGQRKSSFSQPDDRTWRSDCSSSIPDIENYG
ncbi:hypothetical protein RvY_15065 [Ramazzottius varieornatus]|uniref:Uncharacterized protein n=1 Tax=Ramazzottius varieornatus TaxID=947166 RepID=A0A1D1VTJ7_RAMVA|nr:hypothetical protein RvY_15065 [Ramazzottius varieornatus]